MSTEQDFKIASSMLQDIDKMITDEIGLTPARNYSENYDPALGIFCERMLKECDIALNKAPDNALIKLNVLLIKAKLYGNWQKIVGGLQHKKAISCYEEALVIANDNIEAEAQIRFVYGIAGSILGVPKEKNISNLQRVIEIVGLDHKMGIESAKEIERIKASKSKGCFIATAVYGDEYAKEVITLKLFRDNYLLNYSWGKSLIKFYYFISPSIASFISKKSFLKIFLRRFIIKPLVTIINKNWTI